MYGGKGGGDAEPGPRCQNKVKIQRFHHQRRGNEQSASSIKLRAGSLNLSDLGDVSPLGRQAEWRHEIEVVRHDAPRDVDAGALEQRIQRRLVAEYAHEVDGAEVVVLGNVDVEAAPWSSSGSPDDVAHDARPELVGASG